MRAVLVFAIACEASAPQAAPASRPVAAPDAALAPTWALKLETFSGPCGAGQVCGREWLVTAQGDVTVTTDRMPADPMKPMEQTTEHRALSRADRDALAAIVASKEFTDGMTHGFVDNGRVCSSDQREPDTSLELDFSPRGTGFPQRQFILHCTSYSAGDNLAKRIDRLVR